jgi:hypothetical protein
MAYFQRSDFSSNTLKCLYTVGVPLLQQRHCAYSFSCSIGDVSLWQNLQGKPLNHF